jgi:hypothetical protein
MRNVILKVRLSVGYKTVLSVKSLEVGLCADPNRAFAELVMDASNRLLDQHMPKPVPRTRGEVTTRPMLAAGYLIPAGMHRAYACSSPVRS